MRRAPFGAPRVVGLGALALCAAAIWPGKANASLFRDAPAQSASPVEVVRARNAAVKKILDAAGDSVDDATRERLKEVINSLMDFQELSRLALGRHWRDRTPEEQKDFVNVFRELVRNSSVRKLGIYRADSVVYKPAEINGDKARVTTVAYKDDNEVEIVYLMHRVGDAWKAYDVIIDDSSTMRTYRDTFNREIAKSGYEAMYRKLVDKLEEERTSGS